MALSYAEGMATLQGIFPTWDPQVLADLLEANEGHLENTIDMALTMEPPTPSPSPSRPSAPAVSMTSARSPVRSAAPVDRSVRAVSPSTTARRPRVTLPDDFLRLPEDGGVAERPLSAQEEQDAMLAQMLQNEIFRQELLADEEFSAHFQGDHRRGSSVQQRASSVAREKTASEMASEALTVMGEKFTSMSEVMKRKMHEAYLKFQTRTDAPTGKDPYSHRPLMQDDSSDEEDGHAALGNTDVRHRHGHDSQSLRNRESPRTRNSLTNRQSWTSTKKND